MKKCVFFLLIFTITVSAQYVRESFRFGEPGKAPGQLKNPQAIDVSADGTVYIVDTGNHRIQLFNPSGTFIRSVGGFGFNEYQFDTPTDIWTRSLIDIYVSDYNNQRIQRFDRNMNYISTLERNDGNPDEFQFYEVSSVALNTQKEMFILDNDESKIVKFSREGVPEISFGRMESAGGELLQPQQLDIIPQNFLIVSDAGKKALLVFDFFGSFVMEIAAEDFRTPRGIGVARDGRIFIADPAAAGVFTVSADLKRVSPLTIQGGMPLKEPQDIAIHSKGKGQFLVYVLDGEQVVVGELVDTQE